MNEVFADLMQFSQSRNVELRYSASEVTTFVSDYSYIRMIVSNLVENGIKYSDSNKISFVEVSFFQSAGTIKLCVNDSGEGIREQFKTRIFEMFFSGTTSAEGTGLGLYVVSEIVAKLRGTICVESEYGTGSKFIVTLNQRKID